MFDEAALEAPHVRSVGSGWASWKLAMRSNAPNPSNRIVSRIQLHPDDGDHEVHHTARKSAPLAYALGSSNRPARPTDPHQNGLVSAAGDSNA
jgi:hypothetical protein